MTVAELRSLLDNVNDDLPVMVVQNSVNPLVREAVRTVQVPFVNNDTFFIVEGDVVEESYSNPPII